MCSTCECDKNPPTQDEQNATSKINSCRKCGSEAYIVLDRIHHECRDCFLESCNKKVRSTIGRSKMLKNNDPILVAYSGGPSSSALLNLIKKSMEYDARREQKFRPSILHIDIQSIFPLESETQKVKRADELELRLRSVHNLYPDWPLYWSTLEMVALAKGSRGLVAKFDPNDSLRDAKFNHLLNDPNALALFQEQLAQNSDLTEKQQFVQEKTEEIINSSATSINETFASDTGRVKFVFAGGSATQLANNLLVDVIIGRGATIRSTVSVCDLRPQVPILRPMRDFSKKEIAFYLKARQIECRIQPNLISFADRKSSIQTVTEAFLSKLYIDYPSTYSTLLRTGNKMQ